jgi:hypothetical protein
MDFVSTKTAVAGITAGHIDLIKAAVLGFV